MAFEQIGLEAVLEGVSDFISDGESMNDTVSAMGSAFDAGASLISGAGDLIGSAIGGLASAALDLAAGAGGALVSFFQDSFAGALEAEQTMARLGQVITSTGGAAGITVGDAEALADEFKNLAGGSDDAIISIIDMGLRMGTISSDEMPSFIQSTLDLGAVMGDAGKAAQLMARAQEDPVGVLGALRKAGILVNETTEAQIKAMVASGDTAGAYALVMDRVGEATAGAAEIMSETTAGQWAIFQETLADAGETIMGAFLPALNGIMTNLAPLIPLISEFAGILATSFENLLNGNIRAGLEGLGESLFEVFPPEIAGPLNDALTWLSTTLQGVVAFVQSNMPLMQETFTTAWTSIQGALQGVGDFITLTLMPAIASIWGQTGIELPSAQETFESVMAGITTATATVSTFITETLLPALTTAVEWVVANWPGIQLKIQEGWAIIQPILEDTVAFFTDTLIPKFQEVVAWVIENWPMIQANVEAVMTGIQNVINAVLAVVVPFFLEKFGEIKAWVDENWPLIQATIDQIMNNISTNIHNVVDPLVAFWNENHATIEATASTIWENIQLIIDNAILTIEGILKTTMQIITGDWAGAWETIKTTLSAIWENIKTIAGNNLELLKGIVEDKIADLKVWWEAKWTEIKTSITTILGDILTNVITKVAEIIVAFTSIDWLGIGVSIIEGIKNGIGNAVGGLVSAAADAAWNAFQAARNALGISSPSRLFSTLGVETMNGLAAGIQARVGFAAQTASQAAETVGSAFNASYQQTIDTLNSIMANVQPPTPPVSQISDSTIADLWASLGGGSSSTSPMPVPPMPIPPVPTGGLGWQQSAGNTYNYSPTYGNTPRSPQRDFSIMQVLAGS